MKIETTTNELEIERTSELIMFLALLFDSLKYIELPYKAPASNEEYSKYGLYVPKEEHEIIKLGFDYKALLLKVENWSDTNQKTLILNKEEVPIFKKAIHCAYNFFIERGAKGSDHLFIRYYEKHFAQ